MRTIWLAVVPVVLMAGVTADGQEFRFRKKPASSNGTWAVQQVQYAEVQPGSAVPTLPSPATAPVAMPPIVTGPVATGPIVSGPIAAPMAPVPAVGCGGSGCGCACGEKPHGHHFLNWLCYRPLKCCADKYPCAPCCRIPLHQYFCGCREGYQPVGLPPCGCKPDLWGKFCATGHRMFAMPTGHGCGSCCVGGSQ